MNRSADALRLLLTALLFLALQAPEAISQSVWDHRFTSLSAEGAVRAGAVRGEDVYIAGDFTRVAGRQMNRIGRYNRANRQWYPLGNGLDAPVRAIAFDAQGNLYAVGNFSAAGSTPANGIARWDGTEWHDVGGGINGGFSTVSDIEIEGNNIYIGGSFTQAGSTPAANVAKWDGTSWSALGEGIGGTSPSVTSLAVHNGSLFVGGRFETAGGVTVNGLARWNGSAWVEHGLLKGADPAVTAMTVANGMLYVAGDFTGVGPLTADHIARLDLTTFVWTTHGSPGATIQGTINAIHVTNDGTYIGGTTLSVGTGGTPPNLAVLQGGNWSAVGGGAGGKVYTIVSDEETMFVGGEFSFVGTTAVKNVALRDRASGTWLSPGPAPMGKVNAVATSGNEVYVAGEFPSVGGYLSRGIAMWDGTAWQEMTGGASGPVDAILVDGDNVYIGGGFNVVGGDGNNTAVTRWSRSARKWNPMAIGVPGRVFAIAIYEGSVYIGGRFTVNTDVTNIAKWDGTAWTAVDGGVDGTIYAMTVTSAGLVVGGEFEKAGTVTVGNLAVWNGTTWAPVGPGQDNGTDGAIYAMTTAPNGDLYIGGDFFVVGGQQAEYIVRLGPDGWLPLEVAPDDIVRALHIRDGKLYVGGDFIDAGDEPANGLAVWDLTEGGWSSIDGGVGMNPASVTSIGFAGNDLYIGGNFAFAGERQSWNLARYGSFISSTDRKNATRGNLSLALSPNPTSGRTTLRVTTGSPGRVAVTVYSALGERIATLHESDMPAGTFTAGWNTEGLPAGVYNIVVVTDDSTVTERLIVSH